MVKEKIADNSGLPKWVWILLIILLVIFLTIIMALICPNCWLYHSF